MTCQRIRHPRRSFGYWGAVGSGRAYRGEIPGCLPYNLLMGRDRPSTTLAPGASTRDTDELHGTGRGAVTVTETLPAGLTLVSMSGGATWNCTVLPTCAASSVLFGGSSYSEITVTVNVSSSAASLLVSEATVTGGNSASAS